MLQDARGDQCDNCGNLLNPTELIDPVCKLTGTRPVLRTTKHIFLDLPSLSQKLQQYIDTTSDQGGWTSNCLQVCSCQGFRKILLLTVSCEAVVATDDILMYLNSRTLAATQTGSCSTFK